MVRLNSSLPLGRSLEQVRKELSSRELPLVVAESFILASISLASLIGNVLILMAIYKSPRLKTPTNYLILSLTLSDLLTALVVVPMSTGVLATGTMFMGVEGCKAFGCLAYLLSNITLYTVCLVAFNRLLLAVKPKWYDFFFSTKSTIMTIVSSWIFQLVYAVLPALANWSEVFFSPGYTTCALFVTNPSAKLIYRTQSEVQVVGGLVVIFVCYAVVYVKMKKSKPIIPKEHSNAEAYDNPMEKPASVDIRSSRYLASGTDASGLGQTDRAVTDFCVAGTDHREETKSVERERNDMNPYSRHKIQTLFQTVFTEENEDTSDKENDHSSRESSNANDEQTKTDYEVDEVDGSSPTANTNDTSSVNIDPQHPQRFLAQIKTTKLMFAITLCFLVSWIPLTTMVVVESYQSRYASRQVELFGMTLLYLGTTFNPVVLPIMSRHFRVEFLKMLCTRNAAAVHPQQ